MADQRGFFDLDERYAALSKAGDPLERVSAVVDFELFRGDLDRVLRRSDRAKGGRPPIDAVLMFRVLVLQALYGLSDAQAEFQILDRRSFGRVLGIDDGDRVPDETTIWRFREALTTAGAAERLFARFDAHLRDQGYLAMGGQIVDASIVAAPRQRMTDAERETVKGGGIPEDWKARPAKLRQKDCDARWTLKRGRQKRGPDGVLMAPIATPVFGYKSRSSTDRRHHAPRAPLRDVIRRWSVTDASRHDGRELPGLLDRTNTAAPVWADTACRSRKNERRIDDAGLVSKIHFRRAPGKPLPAPRQKANAARSGVRSAIEHVFADQKDRMRLFVRTIGLARARTRIGLANLVYNFRGLAWWQTRSAPA